MMFTLLSSLQITSAYYDPAVQRWLNRDPKGEVGFHTLRTQKPMRLQVRQINHYQFVSNNTLKFVDPFGLDNWAWPANGSVNNCSDLPVIILIDGEYFELLPGESTADSAGWSDDIDGVWINNVFYPVGAGQNFDTCEDAEDEDRCPAISRGAPNDNHPDEHYNDPPIPPYVPPPNPPAPTYPWDIAI